MSADAANYKCTNKKCRTSIEKPGKCKTCTETWDKTCEIANAAHDLSQYERQKIKDDRDWAVREEHDDWESDIVVE